MGNGASKWLCLCSGSSTRSSVKSCPETSNPRITPKQSTLKRTQDKATETKNVTPQEKEVDAKNEHNTCRQATSASDMCKLPLLSPDIILEILSWLPVKSLLRMRCVCKNWNSLTRHRHFIEKHISRDLTCYYRYNISISGPLTDCDSGFPGFSLICACDGLIVRRNTRSGKYYIVNPAMKQRLDLPEPQDRSFQLTISFVPSVDRYKLVSIYDTTKLETSSEGWEILTAGIDTSWRPLVIPELDHYVKKKRVQISVVAVGAVVHCIRVSNIGLNICQEILSLDLEDESFTNTALPQELILERYNQLWPFQWNGKLAFSYRMQDGLNILVLENYKKSKWAEKKVVVSLNFVAGSEPLLNNTLVPLYAQSGDLWFLLKDKKIIRYDIASRKINIIVPREGYKILSRLFYICKDSLVTLRGMQPYEEQ